MEIWFLGYVDIGGEGCCISEGKKHQYCWIPVFEGKDCAETCTKINCKGFFKNSFTCYITTENDCPGGFQGPYSANNFGDIQTEAPGNVCYPGRSGCFVPKEGKQTDAQKLRQLI